MTKQNISQNSLIWHGTISEKTATISGNTTNKTSVFPPHVAGQISSTNHQCKARQEDNGWAQISTRCKRLCAGQSSSSTPNSLTHVLMDLALCTGAQPCWNRKQPSPNCSHKVGSMELSIISWYAEAFRVPFTGTKGPSPSPEKQPHTIIPPPPNFNFVAELLSFPITFMLLSYHWQLTVEYLGARKFHYWTCCTGGILWQYHTGIHFWQYSVCMWLTHLDFWALVVPQPAWLVLHPALVVQW